MVPPRSTSTPRTLDGVDCLTGSQECVAVDANGNVLTTTDWGSHWSSQNIGGSNELDSASYTSASFGAVVDAVGDGFIYTATGPPTFEQLIWDSASSPADVVSDGTNYYIYGATGEPVEQVSLSTSTPTFSTYTPSDSSWLATSTAGSELAFWRYDAFGRSRPRCAGLPVRLRRAVRGHRHAFQRVCRHAGPVVSGADGAVHERGPCV